MSLPGSLGEGARRSLEDERVACRADTKRGVGTSWSSLARRAELADRALAAHHEAAHETLAGVPPWAQHAAATRPAGEGRADAEEEAMKDQERRPMVEAARRVAAGERAEEVIAEALRPGEAAKGATR